MLILQIALGIVLAVFILVFFQEILGCALGLLGIALVLAVVGLVGYFVVQAIGAEAAGALLAVGIIISAIWYWYALPDESEAAVKKEVTATEQIAPSEAKSRYVARIFLIALGIAIAVPVLVGVIYLARTFPMETALVFVGGILCYAIIAVMAEREANKRAKDELRDRTNDEPQS